MQTNRIILGALLGVSLYFACGFGKSMYHEFKWFYKWGYANGCIAASKTGNDCFDQGQKAADEVFGKE